MWFKNLAALAAPLAFCTFLLTGGNALGQMQDVVVNGVTIGTVNVTGYASSNLAGGAQTNINVNFTAAAGMAAQTQRETVAPQGFSYLQTVRFTLPSQQEIFRTPGMPPTNLTGTFADPPPGGYQLPDGSVQFGMDSTPWYSTIEPSGVAGAIPPEFGWGAQGNQQLSDTPTVPWGPINMVQGLLGLLNGGNGMLCFETVLVGVHPSIMPPPWEAWPVMSIRWGMTFTYNGDTNMNMMIDREDYTVAAKPLEFGAPSMAFLSAFDGMGTNPEWTVNFVPEPATLGLLVVGSLKLARRRRSVRQAA